MNGILNGISSEKLGDLGHLWDIWDKLENQYGSIYLKVAPLLARLGKRDSN